MVITPALLVVAAAISSLAPVDDAIVTVVLFSVTVISVSTFTSASSSTLIKPNISAFAKAVGTAEPPETLPSILLSAISFNCSLAASVAPSKFNVTSSGSTETLLADTVIPLLGPTSKVTSPVVASPTKPLPAVIPVMSPAILDQLGELNVVEVFIYILFSSVLNIS